MADGHHPSRRIVRKGQRIMQSGRAVQLSAPASRKQMKREEQTGEWQPDKWDLNLVPESSHTGDQPGLRISHGDRQTGGYRKQIANQLFAQGGFFFPHVELSWKNISWHLKRNDSIDFYYSHDYGSSGQNDRNWGWTLYMKENGQCIVFSWYLLWF